MSLRMPVNPLLTSGPKFHRRYRHLRIPVFTLERQFAISCFGLVLFVAPVEAVFQFVKARQPLPTGLAFPGCPVPADASADFHGVRKLRPCEAGALLEGEDFSGGHFFFFSAQGDEGQMLFPRQFCPKGQRQERRLRLSIR